MGQQIFAYLQKHGLTERWIQSLMDEPLDCMADTYKRGLEILKSAMPGIPLLDASIARETIAGNLDYWCPTANKYEKYQEFFDSRYEKGDHIFVYTCLDPAGSFCNRMLDQERLRQVWIGWAPALYPKIEGYLHWGGMSMEGFDPYYLAAPLPEITDYESSRSGVLPAGDAAIMSPGFHQVNLIAPGEMSDEDINEFHSNLREVMLYIKYSRDKKKLNKIIEENPNFQSVERQAADVINIVTGSKLKYPEGKGDVNMCLAIKQMREESELAGQIKGAVETYKDLEVSLADTIKRIAERFHLSESESTETVKQYW